MLILSMPGWHTNLIVIKMYNIFEVKLAFEMLTAREQRHSFWTHERMC